MAAIFLTLTPLFYPMLHYSMQLTTWKVVRVSYYSFLISANQVFKNICGITGPYMLSCNRIQPFPAPYTYLWSIIFYSFLHEKIPNVCNVNLPSILMCPGKSMTSLDQICYPVTGYNPYNPYKLASFHSIWCCFMQIKLLSLLKLTATLNQKCFRKFRWSLDHIC